MRKRSESSIKVVRLLLVGYGILMLYLLFVRGRSAVAGIPYWQQVADNYSIVPFHTISNYWDILARPEHYLQKWEAAAIYKQQAKFAIVNLVGNVVMFIPLGAFLPTIWEKLQRFWKALLTASGAIVAVELAQLLSLRGSCDVDDLILNLCGVALGYILWRMSHIRRCKRK